MTLTPGNDIVGTKQGRGLVGLLLVATPVFLICWLIIYPIISAIARTIFVSDAEGTAKKK